MNRINIRWLWHALLTTCLKCFAYCLAGVILYLCIQQSLFKSLDDLLRSSARQVLAAVTIESGQPKLASNLPDDASLEMIRERGISIRLLSKNGDDLLSLGPYRSFPADQQSVQNALQGATTFQTQRANSGEMVRIYTAPVMDEGNSWAVLQVFQTTAGISYTLYLLRRILLISIPVFLVVTYLISYFLTAKTFSPIYKITHMAQKISAEDLSSRLNLGGPDDEVKRLAMTIDQMLSRLEGAFLRERQFTADASHELRTPLTATQAIINVTREKRRSPEEYEKALDDIAFETERLRALTENLLYIARGEARQISRTEDVDLSELIMDVAEALSPLAEAKGLEFTLKINDGLVMVGDRDALIRLFANLIDNAVKFTDQGKVEIQAEQKNPSEIRIQVRDTGKGISAEHLPHIFERFYRAQASRSTRGSGLGLAIVNEIVIAHQGNIQVTSQVDQGTCFQVDLPAKGITD
jgi:heavy metal sensor kinase